MKEQHRNNKCERILLKVTLRMGFTRIRMYVQMSRHHEQLASRLLIVRNRKIIFRCFRGWKSECGSLSSISKVRAYTNTRNQQIVDECFSMMKLFYKQLLLKKRQAENYHTQTVFARYFPLWRRQTEVEMEFKMLELSAK